MNTFMGPADDMSAREIRQTLKDATSPHRVEYRRFGDWLGLEPNFIALALGSASRTRDSGARLLFLPIIKARGAEATLRRTRETLGPLASTPFDQPGTTLSRLLDLAFPDAQRTFGDAEVAELFGGFLDDYEPSWLSPREVIEFVRLVILGKATPETISGLVDAHPGLAQRVSRHLPARLWPPRWAEVRAAVESVPAHVRNDAWWSLEPRRHGYEAVARTNASGALGAAKGEPTTYRVAAAIQSRLDIPANAVSTSRHLAPVVAAAGLDATFDTSAERERLFHAHLSLGAHMCSDPGCGLFAAALVCEQPLEPDSERRCVTHLQRVLPGHDDGALRAALHALGQTDHELFRQATVCARCAGALAGERTRVIQSRTARLS